MPKINISYVYFFEVLISKIICQVFSLQKVNIVIFLKNLFKLCKFFYEFGLVINKGVETWISDWRNSRKISGSHIDNWAKILRFTWIDDVFRKYINWL